MEAIFEIPGTPATVGFGPDGDNAYLSSAVIIAQQYPTTARRTANSPGVDNIGVLGMHGNVAALRTPYGIAVAPENGPLVGTAGDADGAIVLLRAIDPIGELVVSGDMIKLRRGLVVNRRPCGSAVEGHTGATVIALDHALWVTWINPEIVVVSVWCGHFCKGAASVHGLPGLDVQDVQRFRVLRVSIDVAVIPGPQPEAAVLTEPLPGSTAIV